jgi:capsule biosynthesis phosphatase
VKGADTEATPVLVVDVDGTLAGPPASPGDYRTCPPNLELVQALRELRQGGWRIVLDTARTMRTHRGNIGIINATTLPVLVDWLLQHNIPYDEIHVGKPWPAHRGFVIDDRAVRPTEFLELGAERVGALLDREAEVMQKHWG